MRPVVLSTSTYERIRELDPARFEALAAAVLRPDPEGKGVVVDCASREFQAFKAFPMSDAWQKSVQEKKANLPTAEEWLKDNGPKMWGRLHRVAKTASAVQFSSVLQQIRKALPCGDCKLHAREYIDSHPWPRSTPEARFAWTVNFHNDVNQRLGKPLVSLEDANAMFAAVPVIIEHGEGMGDNVVFTGALRDLHATYPGRFRTAVESPAWLRDLYTHNPNIVALTPEEQAVAKRVKHYTYGDRWNDLQHLQFMHARGLSKELGVDVPVRRLGGEIVLSEKEKAQPPIVEGPYWLVSCGHKSGWSVKMWPPEHFQKVVDHFKGRITFVQVGNTADTQYLLDGVVDFLDRPLRELMPLVYRADGVLCPVSFLLHLAAAVPTMPGRPTARAAVVIAGGRETPHFVTYTGQALLSSIGKLDCCANGGCWKTDVVRDCPRPVEMPSGAVVGECMRMIPPGRVIAEIEERYELGDKPVVARHQVNGGTRLFKESQIHPHAPEERAELFHARDAGSTEEEYLELLATLVRTTKPANVLETGCFMGFGSVALAGALKRNGFGRLWTCDTDANCIQTTQQRLQEYGVADRVMLSLEPSTELIRSTEQQFDFAFLDSHLTVRAEELKMLLALGRLAPRAIVAIHDTSRLRTWPAGVRDGDGAFFWTKLLDVVREFPSLQMLEFPLSRGMLLLQVSPQGLRAA